MKSLNISYMDRIDHLRFFAAVMLMIHHFRGNINWDGTYSANAFARLWMENGSSGVSFFLVLTGFLFCLISNCGEKQIRYSGYLYNRILRIFPLMIFLVFIVICCSRQQSSPMDIFRIITLQLNTGNSYTGWGHEFFPSGPIWTIAVEFQFYLIFPFLAMFLNKYGPKYLIGIVILMLATRFNVATIKGGDIYYNMYHTMVGRLDQFAIGMAFGCAYQSGYFKKLSNWAILIPVFVLSLAALTYLFTFNKTTVGYSTWSFTVEAICWGLVAVCYLNASLPDIKPINTALSYLGMTSFSMYLLHLPLGRMVNSVIGFSNATTVSGSLAESAVRIPIIVAISFFTFYMIEKPFMGMRVKYTK
ncbi:acyltransferase [Pantoea dispersa]|uniref:acyltransferase family protein n=1 Tax=Pantoea dispersa TaxID=59814 RepID=UPI002DB8784A|nr:acyltransferase [Pantoea dispersa]MEB5973216.1 acyltransferase [Pantoea dispersa]